jgi:hypothetical protein
MAPGAGMNALRPDAVSGEMRGTAGEIEALLAGELESGDPVLDACVAGTRTRERRVWTEGEAPAFELLGSGPGWLLVSELPAGERALLPLAAEEVAVAVVARLALGPRPVPDVPAVRLPPGAMAVLIGRRQTHAHGLPAPVATALARRLDAGVRHWTLRLQKGARRRNLEVVEGEGGIWRVSPFGDGLVELAPTTTTAVVRELVALLAAFGSH